MPNLSISPEKVAYLIIKAREFDVQDVNSDPDSGSNGIDDGMIDVLEDHGDNPVGQEIRAFVGALSDDEKADLIALMQLGREEAHARVGGDARAGIAGAWRTRGGISFGAAAGERLS